MANPAINTVLHSTLTKSQKKLRFAALTNNPLYAWAFANNRVDFEDGGYDITNPIITGRNNNITPYRYYDRIPLGQTDEFDTLRYYYSRIAGTVIISKQEEDENRGNAQIFKLITAKVQVLEESIKEYFSKVLYGAGENGNPLGLAALIPDDPTTGFIGGIDRAKEPQLRTSSYQFNGTLDKTNIEEAFDDILLDLKVGDDKPDLILVGRNIWRIYRAAIRDKLVIPLTDTNGGSRMFDLGFKGMTHEGIPMLYDENCPVDKAYFINSKYLRLTMLRHVNMRVDELTAPWTHDLTGRRIVWQGQWCMWKAHRTHAVLNNAVVAP